MSVIKKNGKWYIRGRIYKEDGEIYEYTKLAKDCKYKQEAEIFEIEFRKQWQNIEIAKVNMTFENLVNLFNKNQTSVKTTTKQAYNNVFKKCIDEFGSKKINLFNKKNLQEFICKLEKEYSPAYVSKIYYMLNNLFKYACQEEYLQINPMTNVRRTIDLDIVKKEMEIWEPDEFDTFIQYVDENVYNLYFKFLYNMGTRRGEALALQWKDIDFNKNIVHIYKAVSKNVKVNHGITAPKTNNSIRNISMPKTLFDDMKEWKDQHKQLYGYDEDCFVFGFSRPLAVTTIQRKMDAAIKKANDNGESLKKIRIHDFRHSHASYLINNMTDQFTDFDIAKRLGDTVATLHDTYAHWFKQADKAIIKVMNKNTECANKPVGMSKSIDFEQLKQLKELLDMNIITEEEFSIKKKELLGI